MAHGIDQSVNANGALVLRLLPAWHGLGEVAPEWTMDRILEHPGMSFQVGLETLTTESGKEVPGQFATVRSDTLAPLSIVGDRYHVIQHTDEFKRFDEELLKYGYVYETAGVLDGGREIFLLAKMPDSIFVNPQDEIQKFFLQVFSYGGKSHVGKSVATRVVCKNTKAIALRETGSKFDFKIRHTASADDRLEDMRASLAEADAAFKRYEREALQLVAMEPSRDVIARTMREVIREAFGSPQDEATEKRFKANVVKFQDEVGEKLTQPNQLVGNIEGSSWSLYNAISEWADHSFAQGSKGSSRAKAERRFRSIVGGHADSIKQAAWSSLLAA